VKMPPAPRAATHAELAAGPGDRLFALPALRAGRSAHLAIEQDR